MNYDRVFQVRSSELSRQPSDEEKNFSGRRENRRHRFPLKRSTIRVIETRRERIGSLPEPFKLEPRGASETEVKGVGEQWNEIGKDPSSASRQSRCPLPVRRLLSWRHALP